MIGDIFSCHNLGKGTMALGEEGRDADKQLTRTRTVLRTVIQPRMLTVEAKETQF